VKGHIARLANWQYVCFFLNVAIVKSLWAKWYLESKGKFKSESLRVLELKRIHLIPCDTTAIILKYDFYE